MLLDKGADPNAQGGLYDNAVSAACINGHERIARVLLDMGADLSAHGAKYGSALQAASKSHALHDAAARNGKAAVVRLLLENGAKKPSLWKWIKYKVQ